MKKTLIASLLALPLGVAAFNFPGWLEAPKRSNPHDPKSPLYAPAASQPKDHAQSSWLKDPEESLPPGDFSSEADLESFLKQELAASAPAPGGFGGILPQLTPVFLMQANTAASASAAQGYSSTNIQESGVDESDLFKNDGEYLYVVKGNQVNIVRALPAEGMQSLGTVVAPDPIDSIYLRGKKLVILYQKRIYANFGGFPGPLPPIMPRPVIQPMPVMPMLLSPVAGVFTPTPTMTITPGFAPTPSTGAMSPFYWGGSLLTRVGVMVADVSNASSPVVTYHHQFEGNYEASRMVGPKLILVTSYDPYSQILQDPLVQSGALGVSQAVQTQPLSGLLPSWFRMQGGAEADSGPMISHSDFCKPAESAGYRIVAVTSIPVEDPAPRFRCRALLGDLDVVYASPSSLYLARSEYGLLTRTAGGYDYNQQTDIKKFSLGGERAEFEACGKVWGHALNQYSLGEHEGVLRIATTQGFTWGTGAQASRNHVFCLRQRPDSRLKVSGKIEDLAPGERIYSARFIGRRGYLCTFRQIDPLYTLDLADPAFPKVAGELKIPGYSTHLHPLGENHLLTLGMENWNTTLQIFDLSNFSSPALLHKYVLPAGSSTLANSDPKAFGWWPEQGLLALPVSGYSLLGSVREIQVYEISAQAGIKLQGKLDLISGSSSSLGTPWFRGSFIGSKVYGIDSVKVRAADRSDYSTFWTEWLP